MDVLTLLFPFHFTFISFTLNTSTSPPLNNSSFILWLDHHSVCVLTSSSYRGLYLKFGLILVLWIKTVKNHTSILSLLQSWLVLLLWLLTSFQWFLVPVLLHYSNQCSGLEVSISFLNFIPQGAGSCVWFHCQEWSPSQLHSRGNQSSGNTVMLYRFYPALLQGWIRLIILICLPLS